MRRRDRNGNQFKLGTQHHRGKINVNRRSRLMRQWLNRRRTEQWR